MNIPWKQTAQTPTQIVFDTFALLYLCVRMYVCVRERVCVFVVCICVFVCVLKLWLFIINTIYILE